ncbi:MAG: hypothetical protein EA402_09940, partial [Planctomycetota bacterium]
SGDRRSRGQALSRPGGEIQGGSKLTLGEEFPLRGDAFSAKSALFRAFLLADQEIGDPGGKL